MKKVAILQSNYIPWKGYFDIMNSVDEFVIYDDVQYTKRDWRNRNLIKTRHGVKWLTIPVEVKGKYSQSIRETKVLNGKWASKHWTSIKYNYGQSRYFSLFEDLFSNVYEKAACKTFLTDINILFIELINSLLEIKTTISYSDTYSHSGDRNGSIISICKALNGNDYVSGPSASCYLDELMFRKAGINLNYFNYTGYQEYIQKFPPFIHKVSVLDLLFNTGNDANKYLISNFQKNTIKSVYKHNE